jgi:NAD(P)-dependent dehydrogenase (short-subunit alcohol dehydrogenase family)
MKLDFTGKRVLVTGGMRGIGLAIVEAFLEAGARVAVNGSSKESVNRAVAKSPSSDRVVPAAGSMATVDGCRRAVEAAQSRLGGLDVLGNCRNARVGETLLGLHQLARRCPDGWSRQRGRTSQAGS